MKKSVKLATVNGSTGPWPHTNEPNKMWESKNKVNLGQSTLLLRQLCEERERVSALAENSPFNIIQKINTEVMLIFG